MSYIIQPALITLAVFAGITAVAYFYYSADIFRVDVLKRPFKMISVGMLAINLGIILVIFLAYQSNANVEIKLLGFPLSVYFYILYFLGSMMIIFGSRKFFRQLS